MQLIATNFFPKPRGFCDRIFPFLKQPTKSLELAHKEKDFKKCAFSPKLTFFNIIIAPMFNRTSTSVAK